MTSLNLWPIGNCQVSALIDTAGRMVWGCIPRVDGDPLFSALLGGEEPDHGYWAIELEGAVRTEQRYLRNTPVLETIQSDGAGAAIQIIDFCPRYRQFGRIYRPLAIIRLVRPLVGTLDKAEATDAPKKGAYSLIVVDGAIEELPAAIADALADNGRIVTGLVERGVTRLAVGRKAADEIAYLPLAEIGIPVLSDFAAPRRWSF